MMILLWLVGCRYSVVDVQRRMYERRLDNRMERLGEDHPKTLDTMNSLAIAYEQSGQFAKAESLYLEAYQRSLSVLGAEHPDTVIGLENLSFFYEDREQFTEAEPLNRRLYEVYLRHLGPEHPETIFILHNLAYLNELLEDYTEAESLYQDALVKHRQVYGDNHVETIEVMANLGDLQNFLGKYDQAIETYLQQRKALLVLYGKDSAEVLWIHSRLAMVYAEQGRYSDAEQEYTFLLDPTHRGILSPREQLRLRSNLALVYKNQGRFDRWLSQTELIVEISKEVLEEDDYAVYIVQNNLAHVYLAEKRYEDAEQVVLKALQQSRQSLGVNASPTMSLLETLGEIYSVQRRHDQAIAIRQELYEHAKTIYGIGHPDTIRLANNLATVLFEHDQVDQAETLLLESVEAIGQLWGDSTSINQAYTLLSNLVGVYHHKEKWDKMLASMRLQLEGEEEFLRANLFGAEETLRGVTAIIRESADFVYYAALEVYPSEFQYQSARLAMETSLRRKGRIMQSQVQMLASNQQSALHQERILDLQQLRRQEAGLVQNSDPNDLLKTQQQLRRLRDQIQKVEQELSFQHKDLYSLLQPPMIEDVIRAMPEESLFLDFVLYDNDEETIGVFALNKQGEIKSARIDSVDSLQKQLQVFRQTRSATFGKMLYQKLIASIVPDLSRYQYLFISPDGPLSLIPFEILEDPNGEMVIDKIKVSYQSTGRDLVGLPKNSMFLATFFVS